MIRNRTEALSQRLEAMIQKLSPEKQVQLRELFDGLLEHASDVESTTDYLERLEKKYIQALQEDPNILEFKRQEAVPPAASDRRWHLTVPCIIEAHQYGEIFRMAFELHLRSHRTIFLSWRDLDHTGRQNPLSLMDLTAATIFIPDLTHLHLAEQRSILAVIQNPKEEKPHFMAGSFLPYTELVRRASMDLEFLEGISQAYLKLTKPVAQYKREGLLRYFLESLS